jgi:hypothetical protein
MSSRAIVRRCVARDDRRGQLPYRTIDDRGYPTMCEDRGWHGWGARNVSALELLRSIARRSAAHSAMPASIRGQRYFPGQEKRVRQHPATIAEMEDPTPRDRLADNAGNSTRLPLAEWCS